VAEAPGPGGEEAAERCHALYGAAGTTTLLAGGPADSQFLGFSRSLVVNGATVPDAAVASYCRRASYSGLHDFHHEGERPGSWLWLNGSHGASSCRCLVGRWLPQACRRSQEAAAAGCQASRREQLPVSTTQEVIPLPHHRCDFFGDGKAEEPPTSRPSVRTCAGSSCSGGGCHTARGRCRGLTDDAAAHGTRPRRVTAAHSASPPARHGWGRSART
jgi:hypothetical protein